MANGTIDISKLSQVLMERVNNWDKKVDLVLIDSLYDVAKETKEVLEKNTAAPRRKGKENLRSSYIITPSGKMSYSGRQLNKTLHSTEYRLAHLIEDGHRVYTRRAGGKYDRSAPKLGAFKIKRTYPTDPSLAKSQMPELTSKYEMWKKAEEFAEEELYKKVVERLSDLNKL